ncbi:trans-aconitate 2-methyltransferase [Ensifer soli]|uniref:trans-aconitate 2-methyltransferase n=1 Tax=Ciceribacter sp. sgz301302 TaxID=3342379 RepID=UPI0035B97A8A
MAWSPETYLTFEDQRTRPAADLLARVPLAHPRRITDIGCGPGNSTELLARRFPDAIVEGVDSSPEMVDAARRRLPALVFTEADIARWTPQEPQDLIFANAVLQWLPDHARLLLRLVSCLAPGGVLALQMPDNVDEPSHVAMRVAAGDARWRDRLANVRADRAGIATPEAHYAMLAPVCAALDIWRTTYVHPLEGVDAIVDWFTATGLMPILARLEAGERPAFLAAYRSLIDAHYRPQADGRVLLAFPRLFVVVTRR